MSEPASDRAVGRAQRGEVDAVGALYDQHREAVFRYVRSRVGDLHTADDLTGEVFKRMLIGLPRYRPTGLPFRAWLFRIARNLLIDHYRRESRVDLRPLDEAEQAGVAAPDPAPLVERQAALDQVYAALAELDPLQREVLTLRFLSGLSLRETAQALGRTEDSIKALQRRGLAGLRLSLGPPD